MKDSRARLPQRNLWIDCLRGLSIIAVMESHGVVPAISLLPAWLYHNVAGNGFYGVSIFFVISGFLITSNTLRRYGQASAIDFGQFYAMRVARILPLLLLFIFCMHCLTWWGLPDFSPKPMGKIWSATYNALTFQYNSYCLHGGNWPGLDAWRILWSLSVEEVFYLVFPIACFLTRRTEIFFALLLLLFIRGPMVRVDLFHAFSWWGCADLLSLGCMTALLVWRLPSDWMGNRGGVLLQALGSALFFYAFVFTDASKDYRFIPTVVGFGAALFLTGSAFVRGNLPLVLRPVTSILETFGRLSYEIYVFHSAIRIGLGGITTAFFSGFGRIRRPTRLPSASHYWG